MQFFHKNQLVELKGESASELGLLTHHQLRHLSRTRGSASYFHVQVLLEESASSQPQSIPPAIQQLLETFSTLFQHPPGLPPARQTDHHIHLLPNAAPVNVRPN